jgi:hypothetical protein
MDGMKSAPALDIRVEWEPAPGVKTPELAETWARLAIWADGRCITSIEDRAGAFRRSVYTSAYPLAEWIAFNWWALTSEIRPSAIAHRVWSWANIADHQWLSRHNLRAAGNGMPWPDLTLVAEGSLTHAVWRAGPGLANQPVSFVSDGHAFLRTEETVEELARFVDQTIDRLRDAGVADTLLSKEWQAIREADDEESEFARAAARLGLDPYSMDEDARLDLLNLAEKISPPLLDEFLDSTDPEQFAIGLDWLDRARVRARSLRGAGLMVPDVMTERMDLGKSGEAPWERGYAAARLLRESLGVAWTAPVDVGALVPRTIVPRSGGIRGLAVTDEDRHIALILPEKAPVTTTRFSQARALGLLVFGGDRQEFLLDPARSDLSKQSRAFAAELLAPAGGIAEMMATLPSETDAAFDAVAKRYEASPLLVRRQYENQLIS